MEERYVVRKDENPSETIDGKVGAAKKTTPGGITRRSLFVGAGGVAVLCVLGSIRFIEASPLVRPPGGQDYNVLIAGCIRCMKCVEVCPKQVIKTAHIEDGIIGLRMPTLNFTNDYCDWCASKNDGHPLCVEVCPTGALALPKEATAEKTILGLAQLDTEACLAYRDIGCRFCYDACPYDAMDLDKDNRPSVLADMCNGCGACEAVCVSLENGSLSSKGIFERAIIVRALDDKGNLTGATLIEGEAI